MKPGADDRHRAMQRDLADIRRRLDRVPARFAGGGAAAEPYRTIAISGGNAATLGAGLDGIVPQTGPLTLTQAYDPATDTVYPQGLGRGILYEDGAAKGYVLVRHDFLGYWYPFLTGDLVRAAGTMTLTYTPTSGPAVQMMAYVVDMI